MRTCRDGPRPARGNWASMQCAAQLTEQIGMHNRLHRSYSDPTADLAQRRPRCTALRASGVSRGA
eukprot:8948140-Pyramimonas_sp.AAC.1